MDMFFTDGWGNSTVGVRDLLRLPLPQAIVVRHSMTFLLAPVVQSGVWSLRFSVFVVGSPPRQMRDWTSAMWCFANGSNMENTCMDFKIWGTDLPAKSLKNSCKFELVLEGVESILKMDMERKCKFSFFSPSRSEDRISPSLGYLDEIGQNWLHKSIFSTLGWSLSRKCQSKCLQDYTKFITVPLQCHHFHNMSFSFGARFNRPTVWDHSPRTRIRRCIFWAKRCYERAKKQSSRWGQIMSLATWI